MITMMMFKKIHWFCAYLAIFLVFFVLLFFDIAKNATSIFHQNTLGKNLLNEINDNKKRLINTGKSEIKPLIKIDNHLIDTPQVINSLTHLFLSQGVTINKIRLLKTKLISGVNVLPVKLSATGPLSSFPKVITALAEDKRSIVINDFALQQDKNGAGTAEIALWIFAMENKSAKVTDQIDQQKYQKKLTNNAKLSVLSATKISLDLSEANIQDALMLIARFIHINLVISPAIHGTISLHLKKVDALKTFDLILMSHELSKLKTDTIWYILPLSELMQKKQQELKLQLLVDEAEPLITRSWQLHYAKVEDIAHVLQENNHALLSSRGQVHIDVRTNTLCIQDTVDRLNDIQRLIQRLDVPVQQVLIEVHLASVDSDFERELGIHFVDQQASNVDTSDTPAPPSLGAHYGLAIIKLANGSLLNMQLSALEKAGHGELISSPSLFTSNQQTASIESGEEIPYQEISRSGATGVAFKKAVLSLRVTPQVMPGSQVLLQLQVNQDKPSSRVILGVPAITTRQISTHILVKSGQTLVLGGIYESNEENQQHRVPFLGKMPLVGWLFKQDNVASSKRELLIFVTPKVIG